MKLIPNITTSALQKQSFILDDGTVFTMIMYFRPIQQGWFFNQISYGDFVLNGLRICNSPNMLRQFQNQIPFGIACESTNQREPSLIQDFFSGASKLYVLNAAEVLAYSEYLSNG